MDTIKMPQGYGTGNIIVTDSQKVFLVGEQTTKEEYNLMEIDTQENWKPPFFRIISNRLFWTT